MKNILILNSTITIVDVLLFALTGTLPVWWIIFLWIGYITGLLDLWTRPFEIYSLENKCVLLMVDVTIIYTLIATNHTSLAAFAIVQALLQLLIR